MIKKVLKLTISGFIIHRKELTKERRRSGYVKAARVRRVVPSLEGSSLLL